jgi:hypothetical protein
MMRAIAIAAALAVCACAPGPDPHPNVAEIDRMRCDFEARRAAAGIRNGFEAGFVQADLRRRCMDIKQHEAAGAAPGPRP